MNHKWRRSLAVLLLAVAVAISVPAVRAGAADPERLDLEKTVSLTVKPDPADFLEDLDGNVQVDVYKIAAAVPDGEHKSSFVFEPVSAEIDPALATYDAMAAADWAALAQEMAEAVLLKDGAAAEQPALTPETDLTALAAGLYLVIAHTPGADPADYVVTGDTLTTVALSDLYEYTYSPELIVVPSTAGDNPALDEDGNPMEVTTAGGDWYYAINATLKPSRANRFGDLVINKTVQVYENSSPVTFAYRVVATVDGEVVFDDYTSITWPQETSVSILGKIPVGASVTVTEDYPGAGYVPVGSTTATTTIVAPVDANGEEQAPASVSFVNTYNNTNTSGYGIRNEFTYSEETDEWIWNGGETTPQVK